MELWIRSQDKMQLIKINEIHIKVDEDGFVGIWVDNKKESLKYYLGSYKTKERALEVLDEIQKKINLINLGHDFGSPMIDLKNPTYIYEMPEEQEDICN